MDARLIALYHECDWSVVLSKDCINCETLQQVFARSPQASASERAPAWRFQLLDFASIQLPAKIKRQMLKSICFAYGSGSTVSWKEDYDAGVCTTLFAHG
jgi:hypothetical protein